MRKDEIRRMKKEVDDKRTRMKTATPIQVKKEGDEAPATTKRMAYDFDAEGFPIWEERPILPESIGPTPPGWDTNLWVTHLNNTYQQIRRSGYDKLYKSVEWRKKRQRELEEAERKVQEKRKQEEEERNKEKESDKERKKKERRELAAKMEAAEEEKVKKSFDEGFAIMGFNITDDEIDSDDEKEEGSKKEHKKLEQMPNYSKELSDGNIGMSMDIDNVGDENGEDKRIPFGGDLYNSDAFSEKSSSSTTPVTHRKSQRITSKQTLLTPHKTLSTQDVQMLSDPDLLKMLEVFQGVSRGDDVQTQILGDPKMLRILHNIHSLSKVEETQMPEEDETLVMPLTSTPVMANRPIKIEGNPRKRKLLTFEDFKAVWKSLVKRGRKSVASPAVGHSVGSPNKGIVPTKDASTEELLKQQTSRIQQMAKLDTLLKKNTSSLKGGSQNMFIQVSSLRTQLLRLDYFRVLFYHQCCDFPFSHLTCPLFTSCNKWAGGLWHSPIPITTTFSTTSRAKWHVLQMILQKKRLLKHEKQ